MNALLVGQSDQTRRKFTEPSKLAPVQEPAGNTRRVLRCAVGFTLVAAASGITVSGCATGWVLDREEWRIAGRLPLSAHEDAFIHDRDGAAAAQIVVSKGVTYLIGWPTYIVSDTIREERAAGVAWYENGSVQLLPVPPRARGIATPRAVGDGGNGLHLVWRDAPDSARKLPAAILYSYFDGHGWTVPEKITEQPAVMWMDITTSPLMRLQGGDLLLLTKTGHVTRELAALRRNGGSWSVSIVSNGDASGLFYPQLLEVGRDSVLMAGVSAAGLREEKTDQNSVFVARSLDGGHSWSTVSRVHRSQGLLAHFTQLVAGRANGHRIRPVVLVWHTPGASSDSLYALATKDAGETWEMLPRKLLPPGTDRIDAALGCDGLLDIAAHALPQANGRLGQLRTLVLLPPSAASPARWVEVPARVSSINRYPRFFGDDSSPKRLLLGTVRWPPGPQTDSTLVPFTAFATRNTTRGECGHPQSTRETPVTH